jgi:predicted dehydrogenase
MSNAIRFGIVGTGGIGGAHARAIATVGAKLTAVTDVDAPRAEKFAQQHGGKIFADYKALIRSGEVDVVSVCTPHSSHPDISIYAVKRGIHVLCEKPMAVGVREARKMAEVANQYPDVKFGVNFQLRSTPIFKKAKEMISAGRLGKIYRATWIITDWFRSQHYYNGGGWRGTWEGEGGGVLLNQCPHQLDIYQWLIGLPDRVTASASLGKYHKVEIEDDITALLEYKNGATGHFIATTGEWPGSNRFEISGDRGRLLIEGGKLTFDETVCSVAEFCATTTTERFRGPQVNSQQVPLEGEGGRHIDMVKNMIDAVTTGAPLIAPAQESVAQLELGNAMTLAGITGKPVALPLNGNTYARFLKEMVRKAKAGEISAKVSGTAKQEVPADVAPRLV